MPSTKPFILFPFCPISSVANVSFAQTSQSISNQLVGGSHGRSAFTVLHAWGAVDFRLGRRASNLTALFLGEALGFASVHHRFILMVNKQGHTHLAQYYEYLTLEERRALEAEIVRKCLTCTEQQSANWIMVHRAIMAIKDVDGMFSSLDLSTLTFS